MVKVVRVGSCDRLHLNCFVLVFEVDFLNRLTLQLVDKITKVLIIDATVLKTENIPLPLSTHQGHIFSIVLFLHHLLIKFVLLLLVELDLLQLLRLCNLVTVTGNEPPVILSIHLRGSLQITFQVKLHVVEVDHILNTVRREAWLYLV